MDRVKLATEIATRAHKGQTDKLGADYITHPRRVHRNLTQNPKFKKLDALTREDLEVAALLHDVIEDSGKNGSEVFTAGDLLSHRFTPRSIELVQLLTRDKSIPDDSYYQAIEANPLAKLVKLADIADNRNRKRVAGLEAAKANELRAKYDHALEIIRLDEEDAAWLQSAIDYDIELDDVEDDVYEDEI
jgi:(p)ppGpp synthase/HD superfamily hydrolase